MPNADVTERQWRFLMAKFGPESAEGRKLRKERRAGAISLRKRIRRGHGIGRARRKRRKMR